MTIPIESRATDVLDQGTWTLTNADTYLNLISTTPGTTYFPTKILELSATGLKLESTDTSFGTVIWSNYIVIP